MHSAPETDDEISTDLRISTFSDEKSGSRYGRWTQEAQLVTTLHLTVKVDGDQIGNLRNLEIQKNWPKGKHPLPKHF